MGAFYRSRHELIFVYKHGRAPHRNNIMLGKYGRDRTNVWSYPSPRTLSEEGNLLGMHPTPKSVRMVADAILDCTARGDIVLDCVLGSGTSVIAAERTGRRCFELELDPLYVDTIVRRWQAYIRQNTATHCQCPLALPRRRLSSGQEGIAEGAHAIKRYVPEGDIADASVCSDWNHRERIRLCASRGAVARTTCMNFRPSRTQIRRSGGLYLTSARLDQASFAVVECLELQLPRVGPGEIS
jgi:hypothetical protein